MNGTLNTSLGLGAVSRPGICDSRLVRGTGLQASQATSVFTTAPAAAATRIAAIQANQAWMRMWHLEPAYSVKHTDRPIPRPLERSP
jgi:hypothetical protein